MAKKTSAEKTDSADKKKGEAKTPWKKPRITRHGNMRQLTQMSA